MTLTAVFWSLDGVAIDFTPSTVSSKLGGYDAAAGVAPEDQIAHLGAEQGAVLRGVNELGHLVWEGRLSLDPSYQDGEARLSARGYMHDAYLREERVTFLSRDLSDWVPGEDTADHPWAFANNRATLSGHGNSEEGNLYCYLEGQNPTRIEFDVVTDAITSWTVTIYARDISAGTWTSKGTDSTSPVALAITNANDYDALRIKVVVNTSSGTWWYRLKNLRYNCVGTSDEMTPGTVVRHLASNLGWDSRQIPNGGGNILPLDCRDQSWGQWLDYIALTSDSYWRVTGADSGGPAVEFHPWGDNVWYVNPSDGADADLMPQERFNQVRVTWNDGDAARTAIANADPDPFERYKITRSFETNLPGVFVDSTMADYLARMLVTYYAKPRFSGRLTVSKATNLTTGENDLHRMLPGDVVQVSGVESEYLRIHEVKVADDQVVLGIAQPATAASLISQIGLQQAGHLAKIRRPNRKGRRHRKAMRRR